MGWGQPALSRLFHVVITHRWLQLLNVKLHVFTRDPSFHHDYNNYVPMRRSAKMTWKGKAAWQI